VNVRELIIELQKLPQDAIVVSLGGWGNLDELSIVDGPALMYAKIQYDTLVGYAEAEWKPGYSAIVIV